MNIMIKRTALIIIITAIFMAVFPGIGMADEDSSEEECPSEAVDRRLLRSVIDRVAGGVNSSKFRDRRIDISGSGGFHVTYVHQGTLYVLQYFAPIADKGAYVHITTRPDGPYADNDVWTLVDKNADGCVDIGFDAEQQMLMRLSDGDSDLHNLWQEEYQTSITALDIFLRL